jgi:muramoyltetrapeptide carboxypeptidase
MDSLPKIPYSRLRHMPQPLKPPVLRTGDTIRILSLSSPVEEERVKKGRDVLADQFGFKVRLDEDEVFAKHGFFAGSAEARCAALKLAIAEPDTRAIFCTRGGYGSNYLLDCLHLEGAAPKILCGFSDITSLHAYLWQKFHWVTIYGPMVAAGFDHGANAPEGYDQESFVPALAESERGWSIALKGEAIRAGSSEGTLLGGCLNLVEATIGTEWELDTHGSILVLEDRAMKPWQVDKALMHLRHAGKFRGIAGIVLGDFPESDPPQGSESVRDVARRVLAPLGIPIVFGAPIGHTSRPMLTLPLGVQARLSADGEGKLEILEPACST